ncbi:MAG: hypothetical protein Q7R90_03560 [bacterium]|nr:hypothetical protein [bacterium]
MAKVHVPPSAESVMVVKKLIDARFKDHLEHAPNLLRKVAHAALEDTLVGNHANAMRGIDKLGKEGARDVLTYFKNNGIGLELAA